MSLQINDKNFLLPSKPKQLYFNIKKEQKINTQMKDFSSNFDNIFVDSQVEKKSFDIQLNIKDSKDTIKWSKEEVIYNIISDI